MMISVGAYFYIEDVKDDTGLFGITLTKVIQMCNSGWADLFGAGGSCIKYQLIYYSPWIAGFIGAIFLAKAGPYRRYGERHGGRYSNNIILQGNKFHDIAFWGLRSVVGLLFIVHADAKFNPDFTGFWTGRLGLPSELQIPVALAETFGGIFLIIGVFTRISASILSIIMLGAILVVKKTYVISGQGGIELELLLLAVCLVITVSGPGKVSISRIAKRIPRFLQ